MSDKIIVEGIVKIDDDDGELVLIDSNDKTISPTYLLDPFVGKTIRLSITEIEACPVCGFPIIQEVDVTTYPDAQAGYKETIQICRNKHQTGKRVPFDYSIDPQNHGEIP